MGEIVKEIYSDKIKKGINKLNIYLVVAMIFIIITVVFIICAINVHNRSDLYPVDMNDVIARNNSKANVYSYIDVTISPYVFAERSDDIFEDKYYFLSDGEYVYIAYLDYQTVQEINKFTSSGSVVNLTGITKRIPKDIKNIAIDVYNDILGDDVVNQDNFENYFGNIYLDVTSPINDNTVYVLLSIFFGIIGLLILISYITFRVITNKTIKSLSLEEWYKINSEIEEASTNYYKKAKLYLTKNYLVYFSRGMNVIKYTDILWMYPFELRQYGFTTTKSIVIVDKKNKKHVIAGISNLSRNSKNTYDEIFTTIMNKNKQMLIGFTTENKNKVKELVQKKEF